MGIAKAPAIYKYGGKMNTNNIGGFFIFIIGILVGILIVVFINVHLIEPKKQEMINVLAQKQAYYEEIVRTSKKAKYFVKGPMMVIFLDPNSIWMDPNQQ